MTKHDGYGTIMCAKRGGKSLLDATRIDPRSESCPDGLIQCTNNPEATISTCASDLTECPIIDMKVVNLDLVGSSDELADFLVA